MTDTNQPTNRDAATVAYVETSMASLADALRKACAMIDRIPAKALRALLATVDASLAPQAAYEDKAGHAWLSPRYFELASEVNEMRAALGELGDARGMINASRLTLQMVRRRKLPKRDARIVYDQCGLGGELARSLAVLPECAPCQAAFEQVAVTMDAMREEAKRLL